MDESFHRFAHDVANVLIGITLTIGAQSQFSRPRDVRVLDHMTVTLGVLKALEALLENAHRLVHLFQADAETPVTVAGIPSGDVEVIRVVIAIGLGLAQVPRQAGSAQSRTSHSQGHTSRQISVTNALGSGLKDRVLIAELADLGEVLLHPLDEVTQLVKPGLGQVRSDAARTNPRVIHAQTRDGLVKLQNDLAFPQADLGHRGSTKLQTASTHRNEVG